MNISKTSKKNIDKALPWWVEFLFVQVGLPDKLLINILRTKKSAKELIKKEKKSLITFLIVISSLAYFHPVIKLAKNKLNCEETAKDYFINKKKLSGISKGNLKMLSTNFCSGGKEIYEFKN